jgi:PAS domain S-box-containing protein
MLSPSIDIPWAIAVIMATFIILSISVLMAIIIHSRKIAISELKFRLLFDQVFDGLILVDKNGQIISANLAASNILGYAIEELCKLNIETIAPKNDLSNYSNEISRLFTTGREYFGEGLLLTGAGKTIETEAGCTKINIGGTDYALCSFRDITTRKLMETDIRSKNITLKEILNNIQKEKVEFRAQIAENISQVIIPTLKKTINTDGSVNLVYFEMVLGNLRELAAETDSKAIRAYSNLTPREAEICEMLRSGANSKEIADALKISLQTVSKHREHIRKKLVISNKNIGLAEYLNRGSNPLNNQQLADLN